MPQLTRLYDYHAEECIRTAEKLENPNHRAMLLKVAAEWRQAAQARRQSLQHSEEPSSGEKLAQHLAPHARAVQGTDQIFSASGQPFLSYRQPGAIRVWRGAAPNGRDPLGGVWLSHRV